MSKSINQVILLGTLASDPEVSRHESGEKIAHFSLATNANTNSADTNAIPSGMEWHRIVAFSDVARIAEMFLATGSKVYIKGHLKTRKWSGYNGQNKYVTEIVVDQLVIIEAEDDIK